MSINRQALRSVPADFSRVGAFSDIQQMGWAKIPAYYYDVTQFRLPLTATEYNENFQGPIRVFNLEDSVDGHQTNAAVGSTVSEIFLAMGVGVVAIGEGEAFAIDGVLADRPAAATDTPPVIRVCDPDYPGCPAISLQPAQHLGALWYGGPTWRFIEKFFNAYRLEVLVGRRHLLVDESLFDVGMVPTPPEFVGASDSLLSAMPFIREVNDVMNDKDIAKMFLPFNTVTDVAGTASVCLPAPMAAVTYGHPRIIGLANRIFCFNQPILFCPGMTFDMKFSPVETDIAFNPAMRAISVLDPDNSVTPDAMALEDITNGCQAGVFTVPGGTISLGLVLKGVSLQPQAALDYLKIICSGGNALEGLYAGNPMLMGIINKLGGLGGDNAVLGRLLTERPE